MNPVAEATQYGPVIVQTLGWAAVMATLALGVGWGLRRPWGERGALGLLVLNGACDQALYIARGAHLPLWSFAALSVLFTAILAIILRRMVFTESKSQGESSAVAWIVALVFIGIVAALRLTTPDPQAGYAIYQAFHPYYLDAARAAGFFPRPEDTFMGPGFLTTGQLAYPPDTLGLAALVRLLGGAGHPVYLASTMVPEAALFILLCHSVGRSRLGLAVLALLLAVFLRYGPSLRVLILDNWLDIMVFFPATISAYYMVAGENRRVARLGAGFAAIFMVFARPYGAAYAALILLALFAADCRDGLGWTKFRRWLVYGVVMTVFTTRELILVAAQGIYYARPAYAQNVHFNFQRLVRGTLGDWGLVPDPSHFQWPTLHAPLPAGFLVAAALLALLWSRREVLRRRPGLILVYLSPLLLLLGPLLVEAATGYRKDAFNKLYIPAILLFPWYPAFLLSRLRGLGRHRLPALPVDRLVAVGGGLALAGVAGIWMMGGVPAPVATRFDAVVESYRANNADLTMAREMQRVLGARMPEITGRRILYFYAEPGVGLRYFIGGDFFSDYDFWSVKVQEKLAKSADFAELLESLGYPNVYLSFVGWRQLEPFMPPEWLRLDDEVDALDGKPFIDTVITVPAAGARFYVTRPPAVQ